MEFFIRLKQELKNITTNFIDNISGKSQDEVMILERDEQKKQLFLLISKNMIPLKCGNFMMKIVKFSLKPLLSLAGIFSLTGIFKITLSKVRYRNSVILYIYLCYIKIIIKTFNLSMHD